MEFTRLVLQDVLRYTIPWAICRTLVYPMVNVNRTLQKEHAKKKDDSSSTDNKVTKPASFNTAAKIKCAENIFKARGYQGLFDKWEFYVIPFTTSRVAEGIIYFAVMRFLMDIIGFPDAFYLITAIAIFVCDIIGAFAFKLTADLMNTKESLDLKVYLDPKNRHFWKQYEIDHAFYQVYGYFQSYAQLISYWYFEPNIILEIILYAVSRIIGVVSSAPVGAISRYAKDFDYNFTKTLDFLVKKFGPLGLFAGSKDSCIIEIILSIIQVPLDIITKVII